MIIFDYLKKKLNVQKGNLVVPTNESMNEWKIAFNFSSVPDDAVPVSLKCILDLDFFSNAQKIANH